MRTGSTNSKNRHALDGRIPRMKQAHSSGDEGGEKYNLPATDALGGGAKSISVDGKTMECSKPVRAGGAKGMTTP
jgi:hypothetical protein